MNSSTVLNHLRSLSETEKRLVRDGSMSLDFGAIEVVDRSHIDLLREACESLEISITFATRPDMFGVQLTTYAYIGN